MEKELDPEVIKSTQVLLGKYVKRPPLSEKLLRKPPFRFLHDVITTVLKTTGFFENLFEENELISENVKDRDSKILFLNKVIFVISSTTGKSLAVKPSKIVAGQEADKTNELLQCLAQALDDKLSSDKAVKQYNESVKSNQKSETKTKEPGKPTKKANDSKKLTSRSNEKLSSQKNDSTRPAKQDKEKSNDVKSRRKENATSRGDVQPKKSQQPKNISKKNTKEQKEPQKDEYVETRTHVVAPNITEKEKSSNINDNGMILKPLNKLDSQDSVVFREREDHMNDKFNVDDIDIPITKQDDQDKLNSSYTITVNDLNSSLSSNDLIETGNVSISERKALERENKSYESNHIREMSPTNIDHQINISNNDSVTLKSLELDLNVSEKLKPNAVATLKESESKIMNAENHDALSVVKMSVVSGNETKIPRPPSVRPSSVRPSSSRPGAPRMRDKVDNVLKDTDNLLMGKVNIIVENTQNEEDEDASLIIMDQADATAASHDQQELQLSSNEHGHLVQQILDSQKQLTQISGKTEIEWQFGAQKAREAMNQDIEQLRYNIQAVSRVANPLGKLLDHIQEDVEVMRQELQQWSNIYEDVNKEMLKQKTLNEDTLVPFHTKLKQLESDIEEKHDKINDLKILIHKNAIRIEKLLTSSNVQ